MFDPFGINIEEEEVVDAYETKINHILKNYQDLLYPVVEERQAVLYCKTYNSCETCLLSEVHACGWCHNYGCVINPHSLCPKAKNARNIQQRTDNQSFCTDVNQDIALIGVESGRTKIIVNLQDSDPAIYNQDIKCLILLSGFNMIIVSGRIIKDEMHCDPFYKPNLYYAKGTLQLFWGGVLPDSRRIPLILFSCPDLAYNCETCAKIPLEFKCGWCHISESCTPNAHCSGKWTKSEEIYCQSSSHIGRRKYLSHMVTQVQFNVNPAAGTATSNENSNFMFPDINNLTPLQMRRRNIREITEKVIQNADANITTVPSTTYPTT